MVAVLEACDIVEHLVLRNTGLSDDLLGSLVTALMNSQSEVEMINLNLNNIGPQGACILTHLLKAKPQVKGLLLFGNKLGDDGICILINGLTELHIPEENEKQISVSPLPAENEQSLSEGKGFLLSELDIGGNQITCKGIECVASFIRQQPPLQYLGIAQSNGVDTAGWEVLFDSLKINSRISHLILDENQLGDEGAILFADMLRANQSLCKVDLDWNDIGEEGGNAILESLQSRIGCSLEHLSLEGNMISEELLKKISQQLKPRCT
ncbi:NLR family CARD domain-containing protein 3 [Huso huso]|uniref:NLR family CARD domain-containing protein 3 n=1 Tax=Huso huso TaxID=61971 RepID=A0ABR0YF73_HUSHU